MQRIMKRLKEPSTWAGFAALAMIFGVPAGVAQAGLDIVSAVAGAQGFTPSAVGSVAAAVCAAVAVLAPEKK
jgi:hypothetical protein